MSFATRTHYKIGFEKSDITYIAGKQSKLSYSQLVQLINQILKKTLKDTIFDLEMWIDKKVAKRTGKLRKDLKLELQSSFVKNFLLRLKLGTHITYATFVNEMSKLRLRHINEKGYAYYGGHHGEIVLNDPQAVANFYEKMIVYAKERLEINFARAKAMYLGGTGKAGRMLQSRFEMSE